MSASRNTPSRPPINKNPLNSQKDSKKMSPKLTKKEDEMLLALNSE